MKIKDKEVDFRDVLSGSEYTEWQRAEAVREEDCCTDAWVDEVIAEENERRK